MRGYHGAVVAYGPTATGKTHTMQGTPADPGVIPLAVGLPRANSSPRNIHVAAAASPRPASAVEPA